MLKKCADCAALREKLNDAEEQIKQLKEELAACEKSNGISTTNFSSLVLTARAEVQRKDTRIKELQKE